MRNLLEDWLAFCKGELDFDKSHFMGLLKSHSSPSDLRAIFGYFPQPDILVRNAEEVLRSGTIAAYLVPVRVASEGELQKLGRAWLQEMARIAGRLGDAEIAEICRGASVKFVSEEQLDEVLVKDIPYYWLFEEIADSLREGFIDSSKLVYALLEALYGLAADYYLAWYIASPLYEPKLDFTAYFEFWRAGGRCALTDGVMYISGSHLKK